MQLSAMQQNDIIQTLENCLQYYTYIQQKNY